MAARPCLVDLCDCAGVDAPVTNISAEAPDPLLFWGQIWNPYNPFKIPPLGNGMDVKVDCGPVNDLISQYDPIIYAQTQLWANLQALAAQLGCPFPPTGDLTYSNDEQTATVYCPEGSAFSYTVAAGTLTATFSDAELGEAFVMYANAWAAAYAYQQASALMDCVNREDQPPDEMPGSTPPTPGGPGPHLPLMLWLCLGETLDDSFSTYTISGMSGLNYTFAITDGALPDGVTMTQTGPHTAVLSGTPTTPGIYYWTLTATSDTLPQLTITVDDYMAVFGLVSDTLPDGEVGTAYSETLTASGGTAPYTFSLATGSNPLPDGLTLAADGTITGTPTTEDDYTFTLTVEDANGGYCDQDVSISVIISCVPDTDCPVVPVSAISCALPTSLTTSDWASKKILITDLLATPAGGQPEWDGTLPILDLVTVAPGLAYVAAGSVPPVWQNYSFNGILGTGLWLWQFPGTGWGLLLACDHGGVQQLLWQGNKAVGENPIGNYMRAGGWSAEPQCLAITAAETPHALAWWDMETLTGHNLDTNDAACGLTLIDNAFPNASQIAGKAGLFALRIHNFGFTVYHVYHQSVNISRMPNGFTIVLWAAATWTTSDVNNAIQIFLYFYSGGILHTILIRAYEGGNWIASLDGAGLINKGFAAGWHFLALTYDPASGTLGFDVDQSGITTAVVASVVPDENPNTRILLGGWTQNLGDIFTDFDEAAIYNGVLTTAQLNCIYNAGAGRTW